MNDEAVRKEAEALQDAIGRPRRRKAPRVAKALETADHRMIDGLSTWRLGQGPAVLLVHGWEDDTSLFGPLIEAFTTRGRAVVAFDLPGHGYSEGERLDIETAADAVASVANGSGPIEAAIGHSLGCKALCFAKAWRGFTPQRLALIGSPVSQRIQWGRIVTHHGVPPEVADRALALREERLGFSIDRYDLAILKDQMDIPVLFVHSWDDEACAAEDVQALAPQWPNAETLFTDGLGHRLVAQDEDIIARLVAFVDP
jgi:pimeloyl-ACP methyl ester carboxylesterase